MILSISALILSVGSAAFLSIFAISMLYKYGAFKRVDQVGTDVLELMRKEYISKITDKDARIEKLEDENKELKEQLKAKFPKQTF